MSQLGKGSLHRIYRPPSGTLKGMSHIAKLVFCILIWRRTLDTGSLPPRKRYDYTMPLRPHTIFIISYHDYDHRRSFRHEPSGSRRTDYVAIWRWAEQGTLSRRTRLSCAVYPSLATAAPFKILKTLCAHVNALVPGRVYSSESFRNVNCHLKAFLFVWI